MGQSKDQYAEFAKQFAKDLSEVESEIWRLRAAAGLPPSASERAFVEHIKQLPEFRAALGIHTLKVNRPRGGDRPNYIVVDE